MRWTIVGTLVVGLLLAGSINCESAEDPEIAEDEPVDNVPETISYESPHIDDGKYHFVDHFDDPANFAKKWIKSQAKKDDISEEIAKYDGVWTVEEPQKPILTGDLGLVLKSKAKHAAIASRLIKPFVFNDMPLVVQYEVTLQEGQECGGSYIKLLSTGKETADLTQFQDKTPYTIMFGPDKCGNDIKLHFIFRHTNPVNGTITEKHCRKAKDRLEEPFKDKQPHLYQLMVRPDNSYTIRVDHNIVNEGSLLTDFTPAVNPPKEIDDPSDKKPVDWDEREKIPDPESEKPDDWDEAAPPQIPDTNSMKPDGWLDDEEEMIADPNAVKPEDWDQEMDGEWEAPLITNPICEKAVGCGLWKAPLITNPNYKGKWRAPLIENPNYQGKWAPKKIQNPDFFEDLDPFKMKSIAAIGIELWSMSSDILFDNLVITDNEAMADLWASQTYDLKRKQIDKDAGTIWERVNRSLNYKPGWWAIYFIYCMIPISMYIWYLSRRLKEETLVTRITQFTHDNPWMWGVYVIVIGLPLSLIIVSLCSSKDKPERPTDSKKTDEPMPDDEPTEAKGQTKNKSSLDEPFHSEHESEDEEEEEEELVEETDSKDNKSEPAVAKATAKIEEIEIEPVVEPDDVIQSGDTNTESIRKRKPRKE